MVNVETWLVSATARTNVAFENGLCQDYVTEKFFHIFNNRYNVIPVVYNGADMASLAPPHSYINVRDYGTVQELADYLQLVNSNDTLFASYFWWRDFYTFRVSNQNQIVIANILKYLGSRLAMPTVQLSPFRFEESKESRCRETSKCWQLWSNQINSQYILIIIS